jgi:hypothetical protein
MVTITPIIAPQNPDTTGRQIIVDGTVALTTNYGTGSSHGDTVNLQQFGDLLKSSQLPLRVVIWEDPPAGTAPTFYQFVFCPGTSQTNGVVSIGSNLTEYTQGSAYSAGLLAAVLRIRAWFPAY